jgi:hypothetical protein
MITCKSPRKVLKFAHLLACQSMPDYGSKFSRHDFTRPQLFACLVLREHQKKSYRGVEALLEDSPEWRADIGLARTPDHNTLCRAFKEFVKPGLVGSMLDQTTAWAMERHLVKADAIKPAAMDSTMFESRHVSRHFEKRCRQTAAAGSKKVEKTAEKAGQRRSPARDQAAAQAVAGGRRELPSDPGRQGDDRSRRGSEILPGADARSVLPVPDQMHRRRLRIRLRSQP